MGLQTEIAKYLYHFRAGDNVLWEGSQWQEYYLRKAEEILAKLREVVEGVENPYLGHIDIWNNIRLARRQGFERAIQAILKAMED